MVVVRDSSPRAYEFACYSAACAPPPAGRGGSSKGGGGKGGSIQASNLKSGDKVVFAQKVRTVSSVGSQKNGKVGISFKDGGITDLRPNQTLPRPAGTSWRNNRDRTTVTSKSEVKSKVSRLKENDTGYRQAVKVKTRKGTESPYDNGEGPSRDKGSGGPSDARKYPGTK